jgi:hypothetical protein
MAKVKIQGNASGTGVLTVTAPNTSTDRTITLPDSTGELLSTAGGTMTGNISHASNLTLDVGGDLYLDSDGGNWRFNDGGTDIGLLKNNSSDFQIEAKVQDKDIKFVGNDGGSAVTALTLDMSDAGKAIFNSGLAIGGTGAANTLDDYEEGTHQITPSMSSSGSITLSTSYDRFSYTKIGRLVTIIGNPRIDSVSSPVGAIRLTLPFNVKNGQIDESRAGFVVSYFDYSAGAGNYYKQVNAYTQENTNLLTLENTNSNNNTFTPAGTDEFYFSFSYITD